MPNGACLQPPSAVGRSGPRIIAAVTSPPRGSAERRRCRRFRPFFTVETSRCRSCSAGISWPCHTSLLTSGSTPARASDSALRTPIPGSWKRRSRFPTVSRSAGKAGRTSCGEPAPACCRWPSSPGGTAATGRAHRLRWSDALEGMAVELLSRGAVLDRGLFEPAYVTDLLRRGGGQPYGAERSRRIWSLLLLEIWARLFLDRAGSAPEQAPPAVHRLGDASSRAGPPGSPASARAAVRPANNSRCAFSHHLDTFELAFAGHERASPRHGQPSERQ